MLVALEQGSRTVGREAEGDAGGLVGYQPSSGRDEARRGLVMSQTSY